jgi:hypothetical protein
VLSDLDQLGFDYLDLLLLHGPNLPADNVGGCTAEVCAANRAQWSVYAELQVCVVCACVCMCLCVSLCVWCGVCAGVCVCVCACPCVFWRPHRP